VSNSELTEQVSNLVGETLMVDSPDPDFDLIGAELIDSVAVMSLIMEIERKFDVEMPLDDFDVERFRTTGRIAAYLETVRAGR
jgi:acyl carrier protein